MRRLLSVLTLGVAVCFFLGTTGCTNTKKSGGTTKTGATSDKMETTKTETHKSETTKTEATGKTETGKTEKTEPTGKTETKSETKKGARLSLPLFSDFLASTTTLISGEQYARRGGCRGARPINTRRVRGVRVGCC